MPLAAARGFLAGEQGRGSWELRAPQGKGEQALSSLALWMRASWQADSMATTLAHAVYWAGRGSRAGKVGGMGDGMCLAPILDFLKKIYGHPTHG